MRAKRSGGVPELRYPPDLPITRHREDIVAALRAHPVIVVCGDTGSGKTTQLPKLCLEAGRGLDGMIGITQPRRIAARAVAARLAEELDVKVGEAVGLKVRFTDRTHPDSLVKVMTDGILLSEIRADPHLRAYDTLIIDEAHERSLNIDFLLGYLRRIRHRRPDLKLVITSATIDPDRFARHFDHAPVLQVAGRSFPIEMRYRPLARNQDLPDAVAAGVRELLDVDLSSRGGGSHRDILVFLPGERWIREAERALKRARLHGLDVMPLYARLSAADQDRIFRPGAAPRVVLATNVAETSLTVPRIRFVIDSGLARVSRYSPRHRLQGLAVEPIAQANAVQRAGRCGRLAPGVCVRLYSEEDFAQRPPYTDPEILRTNLAGVILRLEALKLGAVDAFPFMDRPPAAAVNDAYRLLQLLGALDEERRLTADGEVMARLPVDPRVARLLLLARKTGALDEGLVIASALSVVDPREHTGHETPAIRDLSHPHADPRSDFASFVRLWKAYRLARRQGRKALAAWCTSNHVSSARMREWEDVHDQLRELVRSLGWRGSQKAASYADIHRPVLAAFVDHLAERWDGSSYRGIQDRRSTLFPGTVVARKAPRWIVAAERIATGERVHLRTVAQVNPRWVLEVAPHLVKRELIDPAWDRRRGHVTAREVLKYSGLVLDRARRVDYGRTAPQQAREIFILQALVRDDLGASLPALDHNRALRRRLLDWEARLRSRDLVVGERAIAQFYEARLPQEIRGRAALLEWCKDSDGDARLRMTAADIATRDPCMLPKARYPSHLTVAGQRLPLSYRFEPGAEDDGITLSMPAVLLPAVRAEQLDWLVPGWQGEKALALFRTLPKETRRALVPLPDTVAQLMPELERREGRQDMVAALCATLSERGLAVDPGAFDQAVLPPHLRMRIELLDERGAPIACSRDLHELQRRFGAQHAPAGGVADRTWARRDLTHWDVPDLPERVPVRQGAAVLELYPAMIERQRSVDLALLPPGPAAERRHREGVRRLLLKALPQQVLLIRKAALTDRALLLAYHGIGSEDALVDDLMAAAAEAAFELDPLVRERREFERCLQAGRADLVPAAEALLGLLREVLPLHRDARKRLAEQRLRDETRRDITRQLDELIHARFLSETPQEWQRHLPRYLSAVQVRLEKLAHHHPKDADFQAHVEHARARLEEWRSTLPPGWPWPAPMVRYRWLLEEFRVSLFAQSLGTAVRVSQRRLEDAWRQAVASCART